ncbi:unnamed protein product [Laminaria digitata]
MTAKYFLFVCIAAVMIPDGVGAFCWGAGCILTVRGAPALTLPHLNSNSRSGWEQALQPYGAGRRRPTRSYLAGKVVWITGASSGLGEQLAIAAAAGGARGIIISGRREDALERVRQACEDARPSGWEGGAGGVRVLPFDVGDLGFVEKEATTRAVGEFGTVDSLVLNAGISTRGSVEETSLDVDKRVMDVNYFGAVGLAKGLLAACAPPPPLAPAGAGGRVGGKTGPSGGGGGGDGGGGWTGADVRFVVVNSVQGKFGMAFRSSYAASKHALVGFFDCLRAERALQGIGVLSVFPGYVRTSLSMNALTGDGSQHAKMDATTASGRDPREIADLIWEAAAGGKEEMVVADLKTNVAVLLRVLAPRVLFGIMAKRAAKKGAH